MPRPLPRPPEDSPGNAGDFERSQAQVGAAITTEDTVLVGVGIEHVPDPADRAELLDAVLTGLTGPSPTAG